MGKVLMKKSKVWMKPRETHSVKESVGGSWRRQGIIGQMRVAGIEMGRKGIWAKVFLWIFCCEYDEVICEEKKRIENRTEERKKSGRDNREGERERNDQCERVEIMVG